MWFLSVSMCARLRLCQITTSAISRNTPVCGGLSVTFSVSQWRGETLQTTSLRNTDSWKPLACVWECTHRINHTWPAPPGTICMLQHCINNKHASVIFTSIQRMYIFASLCLTPLHSPNVLLKAPAAVNSMCHRKRQTVRDRLNPKKDMKVQVWRMDKPDNNDRIVVYIWSINT